MKGRKESKVEKRESSAFDGVVGGQGHEERRPEQRHTSTHPLAHIHRIQGKEVKDAVALFADDPSHISTHSSPHPLLYWVSQSAKSLLPALCKQEARQTNEEEIEYKRRAKVVV